VSTDMTFSPSIGTGIFAEGPENMIDEVVVPLMLCRSVANLPNDPSLTDQVHRMRESLATAREWAFGMQARGVQDSLGVTIFPATRHARVRGCTVAGDRAETIALDAEGLHLLHGHLVFFVHHLAMALPGAHPYREALGGAPGAPQNEDVSTVKDSIVGQVDAADSNQRLVLFGVDVNDSMGRPVHLTGAWYPNRDRTSWEWEGLNTHLAGSVHFPVGYAAELAGLLTLIRLAQPEWSWQE